MSRWNAYLNTCKKIIESFDGKIPLSAWLKDFFRQHKQIGSTDRKIISQTVYGFYRLGYSTRHLSLEDGIFSGLFMCNNSYNELLAFFKPGWNDNIHLSVQEKTVLWLKECLAWQPDAIFPWKQELSNGIDKELFSQSHLQQPALFLRIRPQQVENVSRKLAVAGIPFTRLNDSCLQLANSSKIDQLLVIDEEVVIQDFNSQRTGEFFRLQASALDAQYVNVWDCCCGSGGKSIMAYDLDPGIHLTVSDSRTSILQNLRARFQRAGINKYHSLITDLSAESPLLPKNAFDCIIADVPCSGSGTWSRTPEQLYFFDPAKITYYSGLQKKIISNVISKLNAGGRLVYITCSVFKEENEEMVNFMQQNFNLKLEKMELLKGYSSMADSMFVAVLEKNLNNL